MRLTVCALSAVLLSGCSWLGAGGGHGDAYGYNNYGYGAQGQSSYGANCGNSHAMQGPAVVATPGCAPGQGYAVSSYGDGQYGGSNVHGAVGGHYGSAAGGAYGAGAAQGADAYGTGAAQGAGSYGSGAYGAGAGGYGGGATVLSSQAPYGAAVGGQYGAGGVQTVQGAPVYMAGGAYGSGAYGQSGYSQGGYGQGGYAGPGLRGAYGAGCNGGGGTNCGAMPFGLELGIGTEFGIKGDISPDTISKPFLGGPGNVSDIPAVSYSDAFKSGVNYDLAATYDLNRNTTLIAQVGYSNSNGQNVLLGTVDDGAGTTEDLYGEFSDLEQYRVEGGIRHYMGRGYSHSNLRPYVGVTAGAVNTKDVTLTQSSATLVDPALFTQDYIDGGWSPTASGIVGAEWAVGSRAAIGVETGIRWADDLKTNLESTDRWSVPLKLRGRVSF